jgi:hypothetical protein
MLSVPLLQGLKVQFININEVEFYGFTLNILLTMQIRLSTYYIDRYMILMSQLTINVNNNTILKSKNVLAR